MHNKFPNKIATKKLAQISKWQLEYVQNWSILALQIFFSSIVLIKTITGKNPRTYLCLPSEIIIFTTFPIIKHLFCAKIFCPIIDPQNTTVRIIRFKDPKKLPNLCQNSCFAGFLTPSSLIFPWHAKFLK